MTKADKYKLLMAKKRIVRHVSTFLNTPFVGLKYKDALDIYCKSYNKKVVGNIDEWLIKESEVDSELKNKVIKRKKKKITYKKEYKKFLSTRYWKIVRDMVLSRDNNTCQVCFVKTNLHVHHKTYKNHKDELNHLEDLVTLCESCHDKEHEIKKK